MDLFTPRVMGGHRSGVRLPFLSVVGRYEFFPPEMTISSSPAWKTRSGSGHTIESVLSACLMPTGMASSKSRKMVPKSDMTKKREGRQCGESRSNATRQQLTGPDQLRPRLEVELAPLEAQERAPDRDDPRLGKSVDHNPSQHLVVQYHERAIAADRLSDGLVGLGRERVRDILTRPHTALTLSCISTSVRPLVWYCIPR